MTDHFDVPKSQSNQDLLDVRDLRVAYRTSRGSKRAVDDINFKIRAGEIFGLAGESGCGKSTVAYAICRLTMPSMFIDGSIIFDGRDILKLTDEEMRELRWKEIAIITQNVMNALNPVMKIRDQMTDAVLAHQGYSKEKDAIELAGKMLELVRVNPSRLRSYPYELSGGMKQRVMLAAAMTLRPKLLIADEPTTALDVIVQKDILQTLRDLKKDFGVSVLFITHSISILAEISDVIGIMYAGKMVEVASTEDIFLKSKHPYARGLIASTPSIRGPKKELVGIPGKPPDLISIPTGCRFHPRCPYALDKCRFEEPKLVEIGTGHQVACHLES